MRHAGHVEYVMSLQPLYISPLEIHACVGAIVNKDNEHWVALKSVSGEVWYLDSLEHRPRKMPKEEYAKFIDTRRAAYPIYWAEQMVASSSAPSCDSPLLPLAGQDTSADDSMMSID